MGAAPDHDVPFQRTYFTWDSLRDVSLDARFHYPWRRHSELSSFRANGHAAFGAIRLLQRTRRKPSGPRPPTLSADPPCRSCWTSRTPTGGTKVVELPPRSRPSMRIPPRITPVPSTAIRCWCGATVRHCRASHRLEPASAEPSSPALLMGFPITSSGGAMTLRKGTHRQRNLPHLSPCFPQEPTLPDIGRKDPALRRGDMTLG